MPTPNINEFIQHIMNIKIHHMGGALAGILGSAGGDSDTLNSLQKSAIAFAAAYSKPAPDTDTVTRLSQDIDGYLQTLQVTNALSREAANNLIEELQLLMEAGQNA